MSRSQLDHANYRTDKASLPAPVGCYRQASGKLVPLYDPSQIRKKSPRKVLRTTMCLTEIVWPIAWLPLFHAAHPHDYEDVSYHERQEEMITAIYHLLSFTVDELEQMAGPCIRFPIQPIVLHRAYGSFTANRDEQRTLLYLFLNIERRWKAS